MSKLVSDFDILSLQLKQSIDFLKSCRINESNKGLFNYLDKAINIGKDHFSVIEGIKKLEEQKIELDRFQILINKSRNSIVAYISEVNQIKSLAK